jgi:hypothetical protein
LSPRKNNFASPVFHRALFFVLAACLAIPVMAQPGYRPTPNFISGKPDQAEGAQILGEFKKTGIAGTAGTYCLNFELQVMPRQGAETTVAAQIIGTPSDRGPLSRLTVGAQRWLIQGGPQAVAWTVTGENAAAQPLTAAQTLDTLAGTDLTIFDLQMPFFYWTDFVYEGLARIRGRPAHSFVLYPPKDLASARPELTGVRVYLDTQFQVLVQAELLGTKGAVEKIISILDLKKVGERWIPKSIDFRNNLTRGKTRFNVNSAALELTLPDEVFDPAKLGSTSPQIPPEKIQHL